MIIMVALLINEKSNGSSCGAFCVPAEFDLSQMRAGKRLHCTQA
jgi:hypothetical protein